ncbi:MAG: MmcB family DNA repair protein [Alphaproteobacteria bacterium]|nr:MmcB family DNA repair protein [Alphaproteobacteria bacterium]
MAEQQTESTVFDRRPDATLAVTRGTVRLLRNMGMACLTEVSLNTGRRVDVLALDKKGLATVVEVKSSLEDFAVDAKWTEYLPFCDRFYFAVPVTFPTEILPDSVGLIIADAYGASIERPAAEGTMNGTRRKSLTLRFARLAADRWSDVIDPKLTTKRV